MKLKNKIFILLSIAISIVVYQLNKRPVLGCFEKSKAELGPKGHFGHIEVELKLELGQIWIMTTHKDRDNLEKAHQLNALTIDTFVKNCESYFYDGSTSEETKFLYDVVLSDLKREKSGVSMLKSNDKGILRIQNPETKMLINYERK